MDGLIAGRIVHYIPRTDTYRYKHYAAIVSLVLWEGDKHTAEGYVHLHILNPYGTSVLVEKNVPYDADGKPHTWHWIPQV